jgi:broad specificity polyphosphatase/5'/3'-nucleotidase SurE
MNVNFPDAPFADVKGIKVAGQGRLNITWNVHKKSDPSDHPYYWINSSYERETDENSDVVLLEEGNYITITPLQNRHEFSDCICKLEEIFASNA